jgi:nucleotide-binding universal stress UspA family protein
MPANYFTSCLVPTDSALFARGRLNGVDLIVLGTHRRSGLAHILKGSVAERVLRTAPSMVLTIQDAMTKAP